MTSLYYAAFAGVGLVVLALMLDAMRNVTRKPVWHDHVPYVPKETPRLRQVVAVQEVDPRHSGFAGLTNEREFQLTA